jgi:molybdopterin/thiamine biosynthesis adenylyltransferase
MAQIIVVGAGAIGSHLIPHVARSPHVSHVTVIDSDHYDTVNVRSQQIDTRHVGRPKATVQAGCIRRINPALRVTPICAAIEDLPLGRLRGAVLLSCLDSRKARMVVNQAAWRLGVPWIDAGISADHLLARVRVLVPGPETPCLECAWDQADYDAIDQTYPCAQDARPTATNAPPALAALAASLQAIECDTLLSGDAGSSLGGRDVLLSARHHTHYVTTYRRNPSCRMPDHDGWRIDTLDGSPAHTTLAEVLALGSTLRGASSALSIGIAGQRFATELGCRTCATSRGTIQLERHARRVPGRCPQCGRVLSPAAFGLYDMLPADRLSDAAGQQPLSAFGVCAGDVLTLRTPELDAHLEVRGKR